MARILIAEDEKPMARALQVKLTNQGYEVTVVENGEEAITKINTNKYDLVLLDLIMPVVDGFKVLKACAQQVPIIVTTNLSQTEDEQRVKELGALDYLVKSNTTLKEIVDRVVQAVGPAKKKPTRK